MKRIIVFLLVCLSCFGAMAQNQVAPLKVDSISSSGKASYTGDPVFYRALCIDKDGLFLLVRGPEITREKRMDTYNILPLDKMQIDNDGVEEVLFALIDYNGELYLMEQGSDLVLQRYDVWLCTIKEGDAARYAELLNEKGQLYLPVVGSGKKELHLVPRFPPDVVKELAAGIPGVEAIMNTEFGEKARKKDYYRFDEYGNLDEFHYTFNDGVMLDYKASIIQNPSGTITLSRDGRDYVKGHQSGMATYTFPGGNKIRIDKIIDSDSYERLLSNVSGFSGFSKWEYNDFLEVSFSNGVTLKRWEQKDGYIALTGWKGTDIAGSEFDTGNEPLGQFSDPSSAWAINTFSSALYKVIVFDDCVFERINKTVSRIRYPDGTFFEGGVEFSINDEGKNPPALCSAEVVQMMTTLMGMDYHREKVVCPFHVLYDVNPVEGKWFDSSGNLFKVMKSPTEWFEATSDGHVTEVYVDGKPLPPGFSRDKRINEYNGEMKMLADRLRAEEEAAREAAAKQKAKEEENRKWRQSMRAKYGSAIDKLASGKVPRGVDIGVFDAVRCYVELRYDGGNTKRYFVTMATALGGARHISVWTYNGKITDVSYYD